MKKKNWLMTIAFAVLALTIVSTCVIGSTYAKFTSKVDGSGTAQAAGFSIGAGSTTGMSVTAKLVAPGVTSETAYAVSYFSQVDTIITVAGATDVTLTGGLTTDGWSGLVTAYNNLHKTDNLAVSSSLAISDVFKVTIGDGTGTLTADFIAAAKAAGLTVKAASSAIQAMANNASAAVNIPLVVKITWANNYVTAPAGSGDDAKTAEQIMDSFDTYLGNQIATYATGNSGAATTIGVTLPITVTQNTGAAITGWDAASGS